MRDPADEMVLEAAANAQADAIVAYNLRDFGTAQFFEQRAALTSGAAAQTAWDKVGSQAALATDTWSQ